MNRKFYRIWLIIGYLISAGVVSPLFASYTYDLNDNVKEVREEKLVGAGTSKTYTSTHGYDGLDRLDLQTDWYWNDRAGFFNDRPGSRTGVVFPEENLDNLGWLTNDTITAAMLGIAAVRAGKATIETLREASAMAGEGSLMTKLGQLIGKRFSGGGASLEELQEALSQKAPNSTIGETQVLAKGPRSHLNSAIGEAHGWQEALDRGQVGIKAPGKVTTPGPDFITYDPKSESVVVWDAKYRGPGGTSPSTIPSSTMQRWMPKVREAVEAMPEGPDKVKALDALNRGAVIPRIFKWPK